MEQHPVPQNVTTFQFRLVGDMTIKQFGYLAGGIIGGYICYKLPLPFFFTWPLAITSGLLGFGLAFVPVEERPMDVWIASFFRNVYSPTQWVWQKEKRAPKEVVVPKPTHVPPSATPKGTILSVHRATSPIEWLRSLLQSKSKQSMPSLSPGFSFTDALTKGPQKPIPPPAPKPTAAPAAARAPEPPPAPRPVAHDRVVELQTQLSESLSQRERLERELIAIRQRLDNQASTQTQPTRQATMAPPTVMTPTTSVRVISPDSAVNAGLPRLTTFPNVVTGIVKDSYGNLLAGMLVTVRDKDDMPLRALKTNRLGQFAASTPLPNGTYVVEIEDPKEGFIFDKAQITLAGSVAPAIEVAAKSLREVERDKLAKEIFGNQQGEFTMTKSQ